MTTSPPETPTGAPAGDSGDHRDQGGGSGPRATASEIRDLGRLRRSVTDRKVAGVAGGLARHLDIDPVILRVAFVVLAFFGGAGLILYAAAWALVPEEDHDRAAVDLDERSRTVVLVALGVVATLALVGDSWGAFWFPWPLAVLALVVGLLWLAVGGRSGRRDRSTWTPPPAVDPETGEPLPPAASGATGWPAGGGYAGYAAGGGYGGGYGEHDTGYAAAYTPAPRPRDPRKRGPRLFWFTLALIAFSLGVLGSIDQAGVGVADSAYAALAVGVTGVMLLVGATTGRAGGLILIGLVASVALVGTTVADRWDGDRVEVRPTSAAAVQDSYTVTTGELVLDLSDVEDLDELDGRSISVTGDAGRLEVILPGEVDVEVEASVQGPGGYELFGMQGGGIGWTQRASQEVTDPGAPALTLDADLGVGEIFVTSE